MKRYVYSIGFMAILMATQANAGQITINLKDQNNQEISNGSVYIPELKKAFVTDEQGQFTITALVQGQYTLRVASMGNATTEMTFDYAGGADNDLEFVIGQDPHRLKEVEVFGNRENQEDKLDALTRMPLAPNAQIQAISIISDKVIADQGSLTISEVARNVPGVYTFATYGNQRESMSMRGFRGVPILKNGVRVNSDFRGTGVLTDMQGVESMQVLKGASAITQGVATDIGSPGGVINIVSKTPKFMNAGVVSMRVGSWNQLRPAFDVQQVLNKEGNVAFRINGAYENIGSYRPGVGMEKFYINPSLAWEASDKTTIIMEMDYMNDHRTPDPGTINRAANDSNAIYQIPYDYFPGFQEQKNKTNNLTYALRLQHDISGQFEVRAAFYGSQLLTEGVTTTFVQGNAHLPRLGFDERYRTIGASMRDDVNHVLQLDFIGKDLRTGPLQHTFMAGVDIRMNKLQTETQAMKNGHFVDMIDFTGAFGHKMPDHGYEYVKPVKDSDGNILEEGYYKETSIGLIKTAELSSNQTAFGVLVQDVIAYKDWAKLYLGARYSSVISHSSAASHIYTDGNAWDPSFGLMVKPIKQLQVFGSYTTSTSIRSANNLDTLGNHLGRERISQWEAGIKSDWLNKRLRVNITAFKINNRNMAIPVYDANWNETGFFMRGGNDERKGIEVEVLGRITDNLELVSGYAFIDAQYKEHVAYYPGSAPLNTPRHTANAWLKYEFTETALKGLSLSAGYYYIGERPVNDYAQAVTHEGIIPGQKPFMIRAVSTVNAQVSYRYKDWQLRLIGNNLMNSIGYNAYRTSFINQTDPRNFAAVLNFYF